MGPSDGEGHPRSDENVAIVAEARINQIASSLSCTARRRVPYTIGALAGLRTGEVLAARDDLVSDDRHTFASQWVLAGQPIEKLREIMDHSTVQMTERYAHLSPDRFSDKDRRAIKLSLAPGFAVAGPRGHGVVIGSEASPSKTG